MYQWRQNVDRFVHISTPLITCTKNQMSKHRNEILMLKYEMDNSDERGDSFALEKSPSVMKGKICQISVMTTLACIIK